MLTRSMQQYVAATFCSFTAVTIEEVAHFATRTKCVAESLFNP
jgi:hypothetical protein